VKENNGAVPERVICYRDGVGRSGIKEVESTEI